MEEPMDHAAVQRQCEALLRGIGVPGFIIFGWKKGEKEFGVVSSYRDMPKDAAIKGMTWALHDFVNKAF